MTWNSDNIPDLSGQTAIVTGANAGLGLETARVLASKGAHVVLGCRNETRGQDACRKIQSQHPDSSVELIPLDLSCLVSVVAFVERFGAAHSSLDLLVNNAGVMTPPAELTVDGFELQIGVNFLGHFALTGRLFPLLKQAPETRIVTLSSVAHRWGQIEIERFRSIDGYKAWREYGQSKLACLMFALDLQDRLSTAGLPMLSLAAHPGGTKTELQRHSLMSRVLDFLYMDVSQGALPTLYCATEPSAQGGSYVGPGGFGELRGAPAPAKISRRAQDAPVRKQLWEAAEQMTGVRFDVTEA